MKAASTCVFRFLHDRVQQAAYSLIPEEEKDLTHLRIGRLLWAHIPPEKLEEDIHSVVNQLNMGYKLITDPQERWNAGLLNYSAGKKACSATAYLAAVKYLDTAVYLLAGELHEEDFLETGGGESKNQEKENKDEQQKEVEKDNGGEEDQGREKGREGLLDCRDDEHRKETMAIVLQTATAHYLSIDFDGAKRLCQVCITEWFCPQLANVFFLFSCFCAMQRARLKRRQFIYFRCNSTYKKYVIE